MKVVCRVVSTKVNAHVSAVYYVPVVKVAPVGVYDVPPIVTVAESWFELVMKDDE